MLEYRRASDILIAYIIITIYIYNTYFNFCLHIGQPVLVATMAQCSIQV